MAALVVEPAGVVELVGDVRIVPDVAFARRRGHVVAGTGAADGDEALAVGRPLERAGAVLQMRQRLGFAAFHAENADLRPRRFTGWILRRGAGRKKCELRPIRAPAWRSGVHPLGGEAPRS